MPLAIRRIKRAWQSIQYDTLAKHMDTYFDESENLLSECSTYSTPTLLQGMRRRERGEMGLLARFSHIFGSQREVWITFNVTEKFAKFYAFWVFYETPAASSQTIWIPTPVELYGDRCETCRYLLSLWPLGKIICQHFVALRVFTQCTLRRAITHKSRTVNVLCWASHSASA